MRFEATGGRRSEKSIREANGNCCASRSGNVRPAPPALSDLQHRLADRNFESVAREMGSSPAEPDVSRRSQQCQNRIYVTGNWVRANPPRGGSNRSEATCRAVAGRSARVIAPGFPESCAVKTAAGKARAKRTIRANPAPADSSPLIGARAHPSRPAMASASVAPAKPAAAGTAERGVAAPRPVQEWSRPIPDRAPRVRNDRSYSSTFGLYASIRFFCTPGGTAS